MAEILDFVIPSILQTGNINDLLIEELYVKFIGSGQVILTGIDSSKIYLGRKSLVIINHTNFDLILKHNDNLSKEGNRFLLFSNQDFIIPNQFSVTLTYMPDLNAFVISQMTIVSSNSGPSIIPTLQQVVDQGNITTTNLILKTPEGINDIEFRDNITNTLKGSIRNDNSINALYYQSINDLLLSSVSGNIYINPTLGTVFMPKLNSIPQLGLNDRIVVRDMNSGELKYLIVSSPPVTSTLQQITSNGNSSDKGLVVLPNTSSFNLPNTGASMYYFNNNLYIIKINNNNVESGVIVNSSGINFIAGDLSNVIASISITGRFSGTNGIGVNDLVTINQLNKKITGPNSSIDNNIALFSGNSGNILKQIIGFSYNNNVLNIGDGSNTAMINFRTNTNSSIILKPSDNSINGSIFNLPIINGGTLVTTLMAN